MTNKQHCPTLTFRNILHFSDSLLLKFGIPYSQHLIYYKYIRF